MDKKMLKKTRFLITIVVFIFIVLFARLAYLQIFHYDHYWGRAEKNRLRILPITAPRGEIFDKNGHQLVTNRPGFTVSLVDLGSGYDQETISYLSGLLEMEVDEITEKIDAQFYRRYLPIRLKTDVSIETISKIAERRMELPGVLIEVQPIRNFVYGNFASHILGYMGEGAVPDRVKEQWKEAGYEYGFGDLVGQAGIEMAWEPFLRGDDGGIQVEVNSTGQAIREFERVEPKPGDALYLTIDSRLQQVVEQALNEIVQELWDEGSSYAGEAVAVALNPQSRAILVIGSLPSYDHNTFSEDFPLLKDYRLCSLVNKTIE